MAAPSIKLKAENVLMSAAGEAVDAGVLTAAIGVDAPLERHPRGLDAVDDGFALDLFEDDTRGHGPTLSSD